MRIGDGCNVVRAANKGYLRLRTWYSSLGSSRDFRSICGGGDGARWGDSTLEGDAPMGWRCVGFEFVGTQVCTIYAEILRHVASFLRYF